MLLLIYIPPGYTGFPKATQYNGTSWPVGDVLVIVPVNAALLLTVIHDINPENALPGLVKTLIGTIVIGNETTTDA